MKEKIQQQFYFVVELEAGKECLFLMLCQDHPKIMEWLRWRWLMTDLLSTRFFTIYANEGGKACEFIGLFLLYRMVSITGKIDFGIYRATDYLL